MNLLADDEMDVYFLLLIILLIQYHNSIHKQVYLLQQSILHPNLSPWQHLLENVDASSFLLLTGLNQITFDMLLDVTIPWTLSLHWNRWKRGSQWSLLAEGWLGILLFYVGSMMPYKHLCLLFGVTPSACSCIIRKMLFRVVKRLYYHPYARVQFPN